MDYLLWFCFGFGVLSGVLGLIIDIQWRWFGKGEEEQANKLVNECFATGAYFFTAALSIVVVLPELT